MSNLAKNILLAFFLKGISAVLFLLSNIVLARVIGINAAGVYFLSFSILILLTTISRLGVDNVALRLVSAGVATGKQEEAGRVFSNGTVICSLASLVIGTATFFLAGFIANNLFSLPELAPVLRVMSVSVPLFALSLFSAEALKGLNAIWCSLLIQDKGVIVPLVFLILITLCSGDNGATCAATALFFACATAFFVGLMCWRKYYGPTPIRVDWPGCRNLLTNGAPLLVAATLNIGMPYISTLILGVWADSADVALFSAACQLATSVALILIAANNVIAPRLAAYYATDKRHKLIPFTLKSGFYLFLLTTPVVIFLLLFGDHVLSLYGAEFADGDAALGILAMAQLIGVAMGPVGYLLMMTNNESMLRNSVVLSAIVNITLNILLIPSFGVLGAAVATGCGIVTFNIASLIFATCTAKNWRRS